MVTPPMVLIWLLMVVLVGYEYGVSAQTEVTVCEDEVLSFRCTSNHFHTWSGTALGCSATVSESTSFGPVTLADSCNTATLVKDGDVTSTLMITAVASLNEATVLCSDESGVMDIDSVIHVATDTTPTIVAATAINDTCVDVDFMTPSDTRQCIQSYMATATDSAGTATVGSVEGSSTSLTATVCGLCPSSCDYSFTVQGVSNVFGLGDPSTPESLTAVNGCPSPSDFGVISVNNMCSNTIVESTLSSKVVATDDCLNPLPSNNFATSGTSVMWSGLMQCSMVSFQLHPRCCSPLATSMYLGPADSFSEQVNITTSYSCASSAVQVILVTNNNSPPGTTFTLVVVDELDNQVPNPQNSLVLNIDMVYENYSASAVATCGNCTDSDYMKFVPNFIVDHEVESNEASANISVTYYTECEDDTSSFMIKVEYGKGRVIQGNVIMPKQTFLLEELDSGVSYQYVIEVTSGVNRVGAVVDGTFTTTTSSSGGLSGGAIAGIAIGVVVIVISIVLIAVGIVVLCYYFGCCCFEGGANKVSNRQMTEPNSDNPANITAVKYTPMDEEKDIELGNIPQGPSTSTTTAPATAPGQAQDPSTSTAGAQDQAQGPPTNTAGAQDQAQGPPTSTTAAQATPPGQVNCATCVDGCPCKSKAEEQCAGNCPCLQMCDNYCPCKDKTCECIEGCKKCLDGKQCQCQRSCTCEKGKGKCGSCTTDCPCQNKNGVKCAKGCQCPKARVMQCQEICSCISNKQCGCDKGKCGNCKKEPGCPCQTGKCKCKKERALGRGRGGGKRINGDEGTQ